MSRFVFFLISIIVIFSLQNGIVIADWIETEKVGLGDVSFIEGSFIEIPDSPFALFTDGSYYRLGDKMLLLDINNALWRDCLKQ